MKKLIVAYKMVKTILNLPEEVIRIIFSFLSDWEIHFTVGNVCQDLQKFANGYVELGNMLLY